MILRRQERRFSLLCGLLCLLAGPVWITSLLNAQDNHAGSSGSRAQTNKQFEFEVFSFHLHKPGTMPFPMQFTPDGYKASERLSEMIMRAYNPQFWQYWRLSKFQNAPSWVANDLYDLDARVAQENTGDWQQVQWQNSDLLRSALQSALRQDFKLELHLTPIQVPYLNLTVGKHGAKLKATVPGSVKPVKLKTAKLGEGFYFDDNGERQFVGVSMEEFAHLLTSLDPDYPVQDKTGLKGRYDFTLPWYDRQHYPDGEFSSPLDRMPIKGSGLTLRPGKGPAFAINIDHIEKPDSN